MAVAGIFIVFASCLQSTSLHALFHFSRYLNLGFTSFAASRLLFRCPHFCLRHSCGVTSPSFCYHGKVMSSQHACSRVAVVPVVVVVSLMFCCRRHHHRCFCSCFRMCLYAFALCCACHASFFFLSIFFFLFFLTVSIYFTHLIHNQTLQTICHTSTSIVQ